MIKDYFKRLNYLAVLMILALSLFAISCSEEDTTEPSIDEAQVLVEYLEGTDDGFINTLAPTMIGAADINTDIITNTNKIYVIDIRTAADFALGHIKNAVNVASADVITHVKGLNTASYDKIVIACYTGQTAAFLSSLLRLMGYNTVYTLKWGMASWNKTLSSKWSGAIGNSKVSVLQTTANAKPAAGKLPKLNTGKKTGAEILEARIMAIVAEGGFDQAKVSNTADLTNYHICNYWPEAQYLDPGHLPGAYNYLPKASLKLATDLKTLPTDKEIVFYCYTGQTSSYVAAYLRVLGYNAKSLLFGANGMMYDAINGKTGFTAWKDTESNEFELVK